MKKSIFTILLASLYLNSHSQCPEGLITSENNLVKNGDFEEANTAFYSDYEEAKTAGGGKYRITDDAYKFSSTYFVGKGDGNFMAVDGATGQDMTVWSQKILVKKQTVYFFSCWVSNLLDVEMGPPAVLQFSINKKVLDVPFKCPKKLNTWKQFFVLWESDADQEIEIRIVSQNADWTGNDFGLDRIKFYECQAPDNNLLKIDSTKKMVELPKLEVNTVISLRNVLFKYGTSEIITESAKDLDNLYNYLIIHKETEIEIAGHTDNIGSDKSNQVLSQERANSIKNYLISKGIEEKRLIAVGYGKTKPISENETIEGRQKNRRVEAIIKK